MWETRLAAELLPRTPLGEPIARSDASWWGGGLLPPPLQETHPHSRSFGPPTLGPLGLTACLTKCVYQNPPLIGSLICYTVGHVHPHHQSLADVTHHEETQHTGLVLQYFIVVC